MCPRFGEVGAPELADEAYAIRVLDALHGDDTPAVREHDGKHLL
jgi:8-oxo-dGTP diphosphatase